MNLQVLSLQYVQSRSAVISGIKRGQIPPHAVRGGNGTYVVSESPKLIFKVLDVDKNEYHEVDMYNQFKSMLNYLGMRMSKRRADIMAVYYMEMDVFEARYIDTWPEIPDLQTLLN